MSSISIQVCLSMLGSLFLFEFCASETKNSTQQHQQLPALHTNLNNFGPTNTSFGSSSWLFQLAWWLLFLFVCLSTGVTKLQTQLPSTYSWGVLLSTLAISEKTTRWKSSRCTPPNQHLIHPWVFLWSCITLWMAPPSGFKDFNNIGDFFWLFVCWCCRYRFTTHWHNLRRQLCLVGCLHLFDLSCVGVTRVQIQLWKVHSHHPGRSCSSRISHQTSHNNNYNLQTEVEHGGATATSNNYNSSSWRPLLLFICLFVCLCRLLEQQIPTSCSCTCPGPSPTHSPTSTKPQQSAETQGTKFTAPTISENADYWRLQSSPYSCGEDNHNTWSHFSPMQKHHTTTAETTTKLMHSKWFCNLEDAIYLEPTTSNNQQQQIQIKSTTTNLKLLEHYMAILQHLFSSNISPTSCTFFSINNSNKLDHNLLPFQHLQHSQKLIHSFLAKLRKLTKCNNLFVRSYMVCSSTKYIVLNSNKIQHELKLPGKNKAPWELRNYRSSRWFCLFLQRQESRPAIQHPILGATLNGHQNETSFQFWSLLCVS